MSDDEVSGMPPQIVGAAAADASEREDTEEQAFLDLYNVDPQTSTQASGRPAAWSPQASPQASAQSSGRGFASDNARSENLHGAGSSGGANPQLLNFHPARVPALPGPPAVPMPPSSQNSVQPSGTNDLLGLF